MNINQKMDRKRLLKKLDRVLGGKKGFVLVYESGDPDTGQLAPVKISAEEIHDILYKGMVKKK